MPPIEPIGSPMATGAVGDAEGDGLGIGLVTAMPFFQTNFLPDLMQV